MSGKDDQKHDQSQQWKQESQKVSSCENQTPAFPIYGNAAIRAATYAAPQTTTAALTMLSPGVRFANISHPSQHILPQFSHVPAPQHMTGVDLSAAISPASLAHVASSSTYSTSMFGLEPFQQLKQHQYEIAPKIMTTAIHANPGNQATATTTSGQQLQVLGIVKSISSTTSTQSNQEISNTTSETVIEGDKEAQGFSPGSNILKKSPNSDRMRKIQQIVESGISEPAKQQIAVILEKIQLLKPVERLLLYLRMPGESSETDPLRHPQNPLGTRSEINHTINWVRTHLQHDPQVSIPKQDVYNDYNTYCERLNIKPLSTADFGKVMKQVFPEIRPRRLGTRGNSRYCYAAMRKTTELNPPQVPILSPKSNDLSNLSPVMEKPIISDCCDVPLSTNFAQGDYQSWNVIKSWAEDLLNVKIESFSDLADQITSQQKATTSASNVRNLTQKKSFQRTEVKDIGPLKKRRKKKRKGSSSSESSSIANKIITTTTTTTTTATNISTTIGTEHKQISAQNLISIKQEKVDSELFDTIQHSHRINFETNRQCQYHQNSDLETRPDYVSQQLLPMNLVADTKLISNQMSQSSSSLVMDNKIITSPVVQNLPAKIINLSTTTNVGSGLIDATSTAKQTPIVKEEIFDDYDTSNVICKKVRKAYQTKGLWLAAPPNSIPASVIASTVAIPLTEAEPSQQSHAEAIDLQQQQQQQPSSSSIVDNFMMGPPAQITNAVNASPSETISATAPVAKVASRNSQQLRARKLRYLQARSELYSAYQQNSGNSSSTANLVTCTQQQMQQASSQIVGATNDGSSSSSGDIVAEDKDVLPENLGLPRERVISICNMDKQELDDYLNGEEDNSQDQEVELLQYFQTGDAEYNNKKQDNNKLDAINPSTVSVLTDDQQKVTTEEEIILSQCKSSADVNQLQERKSCDLRSSSLLAEEVNSATSTRRGEDITHLRHYLYQNFPKETDQINQIETQVNYFATSCNEYAKTSAEISCLTTKTTITTPPAATTSTSNTGNDGFDSASLANMRHRKHLQQQEKRQEKEPEQKMVKQKGNKTNLSVVKVSKNLKNRNSARAATQKRKIHLNTATVQLSNSSKRDNISMINQKNYIFLPISPNTNRNNPTAITTLSKDELFASPGIAKSRIKPIFDSKSILHPSNMSNDSELLTNKLDPMIGSAICDKRNIFQIINSAPPSPSSQQSSNNSRTLMMQNLSNCNQNTPHCSGGNIFDTVAKTQQQQSTSNETISTSMRSQSVPLQNRCSPAAFNQSRNFVEITSTSSSIAQTPVPPEFADFNDPTSIFDLFSDGSEVKLEVDTKNGADGELTITATTTAVTITTTTTAATTIAGLLLDDIDVNDVISSDFVTSSSTTPSSVDAFGHTSGLTMTAAATTLSSGYNSNSGGCDIGVGFGGSHITSRSVPSTPLPHNILDTFLRKQRNDEIGDGFSLFQNSSEFPTSNTMNYSTLGLLKYTGINRMYDMSKSMPTTPITSNAATPSFRYSPEFSRDFLINGNTVDSATSSTYSRSNNNSTIAPSSLLSGINAIDNNLLDNGQTTLSSSTAAALETDELNEFTTVPDSIMEANILDNL